MHYEEDSVKSPRMPVAFLPHGGGPWPFADLGFDRDEMAGLAAHLKAVAALPPVTPRALLVISAHWEEPVHTVMTAPQPPMLYDYGGFPESTYHLSWPAPGAPALAANLRSMLDEAGIKSADDAQRGFDHGTFIPLMLAYPDATIPCLQISLQKSLDPAAHMALGRALSPLRDRGVFILASGMTYHNMRGFRDPAGADAAEQFDAWLQATMALHGAERSERLLRWSRAPAARSAHPREEHLLPLMVAAGAAENEAGRVAYNGTMSGKRHSAFQFG